MAKAIMGSLNAYQKTVYSQNGEDGVLEEILRRLGITDGLCVDVGASDGLTGSNVRALINFGWKAILIDHNGENYAALKYLATEFSTVRAVHATIGSNKKNSLDACLSGLDVPTDFELLCIDIDGKDYQLWDAVEQYRPKIVIVEINSGIRLSVEQIHNGKNHQGSSFTSMLALGKRKGYHLACHTGNMIFVREDLFDRLELPAEEADHPETLFGYAGPP